MTILTKLACALFLCATTFAAAGPTTSPAADDGAAFERHMPEVRFDGVPLEKAIDTLHEMSKANVVVNWKALRSVGVEPTEPIRVHLWDVPLRQALSVLLAQAGGLSAEITLDVEGNVLTITSTRFDPESGGEVQIYDVGDILNAARARRKAVDDVQASGVQGQQANNLIGNTNRENDDDETALVNVVTSMVDPTAWTDRPFRGTIRCWSGRLFVNQTPAVQRHLVEFLAKLRATPAATRPAATDLTPENQKSAPAPNAPYGGR